MRTLVFLATSLAGFAMIAEPAASYAKAASAIYPDLIFIGLTTLVLAVNARLIILARTTQGAWARSCLWAGGVVLGLSASGLVSRADGALEQEAMTLFFGGGAALLGACLLLLERTRTRVRLRKRGDFDASTAVGAAQDTPALDVQRAGRGVGEVKTPQRAFRAAADDLQRAGRGVSEVTGARSTETVIAPRRLPVVADRRFLPADLEILETPPSPVRLALILVISAFVVAAIGWAYFGRIDIVAVAQGKIEPNGRVKVIQPLEPGKVAAILVANGQHVKAGETLIEMDAGDAEAEEAEAQAAYDSFVAEALRRRAAIAAARARRPDPSPAIDWNNSEPERLRTREEQVLAGDLGQLADTVSGYDAQIKQKEIERDRAGETMASQAKLIATLQERVDMRLTLAQSGSGTKSSLIDAQENLHYHQTELVVQKGQMDAAAANIDVLTHERERAYASFIADNAQKLAEAQKQADDSREKLVKAKLKSARMNLTSPIDGVVYGLSVTTIGQVVASGDQLMRLVPEGESPEVEAYLANRDIGFVRSDQNAVVKIESFPFTRYGVLSATVIRVSSDAIPEPDAMLNEADASKAPAEKAFAGAQPTQNLVFPVTLHPDRDYMMIEGRRTPLSPGMAVTVEIATGSRRILEYVFSPLVETASDAMKER
jgi:hemolysin D